MVKLQQPEYVWRNGDLISWDEATLQIDCEGVKRGLNVFEGIKGYWHSNGQFGIVQLRKHYERLLKSARLLYLPCDWTYEEFRQGVFLLMGKLLSQEKDMWIRTSLFGVEGYWGIDTKTDLIMTAFHQDRNIPEPINIGISTWQRCSDIALPYRIKTGTNYQMGRLARIEGRQKNCQEMILLNQWGRAAEATGSCILIVRDNTIVTPPAYEGALESITVDIAESIANDIGIPFERRPIDRTELMIADEIAICGTLAEMVPVKSIDGLPVNPEGPLVTKIRNAYFKMVRGNMENNIIQYEFVPLATTIQ